MWNSEKRPHQWAQEILEGKTTIDRVTPHLREFVQRYLDTAEMMRRSAETQATVKAWADDIMAARSLDHRRELLEQCPEEIRPAVRASVERQWRKKQEFKARHRRRG